MIRNLFLTLFLFISATCSACALTGNGKEPRKVMLDSATTITLYETVQLKGTGFQVAFTAVLEDSRCPRGAECIRAGEVKLKLTTGSDTHTLSFLDKGTVEVAGFIIELSDVKPYPATNIRINPDAYEASMVIRKK